MEIRQKSIKMVLDFYYVPGSAPCRAVRMTAKAVGVDLNLKLTNLMAGEHLKPEFVAVSIPTTTQNWSRYFFTTI